MDFSLPPAWCSTCKLYRPVTDFRTNRLGARYKTCTRHSRRPLAEDAPPLRSGSVLSVPDNPRPAKRPRRSRRRPVESPVPLAASPALSLADAPPADAPPADDPTTNHRLPEIPLADGPVNDPPPELPHADAVDDLDVLDTEPVPVGFRSEYRFTDAHNLGPCNVECIHCTALHFIDERTTRGQFGLCCKGGDAILEYLRPVPPVLRGLLDGSDPRSAEFLKRIRSYNSALAFTSVNTGKEDRVELTRGITSFTAHGELYHLQGPLEPGSQQTPAFAQLFFYDPDFATNSRLERNPQLNASVLRDLHEMLTEVNPFISIYKTARERLRTQTGDFRIVIGPQMKLVMQTGADRRRENLPTSDEVAAIIPEEFNEASRRDVILAVREPGYNGLQLHRVPVTNAAYMPLHYVLLFPYGTPGWHWSLRLADQRHIRQQLRFEQQPFYRFRLHERRREQAALFLGSRLFQQYIVDAYVACETTRLDWLRSHQDNIRADLYNGLTDAMIREDQVEAGNTGRRVVLPSSFVGSDRFMQQILQDSLAIVRHFGKPTFFVTFTANPQWPEITSELKPGQQANDRPDLIARVFRLKVKELLKDIRTGLFGKHVGHVYTVEYQKRGMPHVHILVFLKDSRSYLTSQKVDEVVCAELPDSVLDPTGELRELVLTHMLHGPCGLDYPDKPCMTRKYPSSPLQCSKRFPKPFAPATVVGESGYPTYQRRDQGTFTVRKDGREVTMDNRWVVPYNPYLLTKYRSHINVEVCGSVEVVKYIHKYIYKGSDRTTLEVSNTDDEITRYVQARYVSPPEGIWRLFEFPTHQEYPPVQHLPVHLKGEQPVYFPGDISPEELAVRVETARSPLMAYFKFNTDNPDAGPWLYSEMPAHCVYNRRTKEWTHRQRGDNRIGRMYHCSPVAGERFYLRLLLTVVRGAKSFEELYGFEGVTHETYHAACIARGLAKDDQEWYHCFDEAIVFASGHSLRALFLTGIRQREIADPQAVWDRYEEHFCDDLAYKLRDLSGFPLVLRNPACDYGLYLIAQGLADQQQTLSDYGLRPSTWDWTRKHAEWSATGQHEDWTIRADAMRAQLNADQQAAFTEITTAVDLDPQTAHFYVQGQGGTGKTFLYKTLCFYYRGLGRTVLCVASTGIAALLLPDGRTSHSQFKIPIDLFPNSVSSITKQSTIADQLRNVDLIIWDEVPMQHKYCFEVVHRLLVDLRNTTADVLFGGVPVILGGDFAQILPVVPNGTRADIVCACLQKSFIWERLTRITLRINMRVREGAYGPEFVNWVGSIPYDPAREHAVTIPNYIHQPVGVSGLIDHVYPIDVMLRAVRDTSTFAGRCLLSSLNVTVTELNAIILGRLPGEGRTYESIDTHVTDSEIGDGDLHEFPAEVLRNINVPSLPPSQLHLKIGTPLLLLRNLAPLEGLCNGTRMVVTALRRHCIEVRLLGGDFDGQLRVLPRIDLLAADETLGIEIKRKQFPVRLCFAMTINKSQGQSFHTVGLDLRLPVFTHGQLYVGCSRTSRVEGLSVLLPVENRGSTPNVVYPEVLIDIR